MIRTRVRFILKYTSRLLDSLMDDITSWAQKLTSEVYLTWQTKYGYWENGFKVFYSPVKNQPNLLIIGYQPGGDQADFAREDKHPFENGDFRLPSNNLYSTKE